MLATTAFWRHRLYSGPSQAIPLAKIKAFYLVAIATPTLPTLACLRVLPTRPTRDHPSVPRSRQRATSRSGRVRALIVAAGSAVNGKWALDGSAHSTGCLRPGQTRRGAAISLRSLPQMASLSRDVAQKWLLEKVVRSVDLRQMACRGLRRRLEACCRLFQFAVRTNQQN